MAKKNVQDTSVTSPIQLYVCLEVDTKVEFAKVSETELHISWTQNE